VNAPTFLKFPALLMFAVWFAPLRASQGLCARQLQRVPAAERQQEHAAWPVRSANNL
jgi:hypothetical protein